MDKVTEYFDQVNESDVVIGRTFKKEAHAKGLIHRVAAIFIFDEDGDMYIQVHEEGGGILDHTVGGHVQAGESYRDGADREMREEVDLRVDLHQVGILYSDETYTGSQFRHMYALYSAQAPKGWEFKPNDEVKKLLKLPLQQILDLMINNPRNFTAGFLRCMLFYCNIKNIEFKFNLDLYKQDRLSAK